MRGAGSGASSCTVAEFICTHIDGRPFFEDIDVKKHATETWNIVGLRECRTRSAHQEEAHDQ